MAENDQDRSLPALSSIAMDLPDIPEQHAEVWSKIRLREPQRMQLALRYVMAGETPRKAMVLAGYAGNQTAVYDRAKHWGIFTPMAETLAARTRDIATLSGELIVDRLLRHDEQPVPLEALNYFWGTSMDKVLKLEQLQAKGGAALDLERILDGILDRGLTLTLSVSAADEHQEPIDVTER